MNKNSTKNRVWEFGIFRLEESERLLLRAGTRVAVTPKVFDSLIALIECSGHLVEKETLMQRLWPDTFVEEGALTRNISDLRKALGEGKFIETVPKRGYRFVASVTLIDDDSEVLAVRKTSEARLVIREKVDMDRDDEMHRSHLSLPPRTKEPNLRDGANMAQHNNLERRSAVKSVVIIKQALYKSASRDKLQPILLMGLLFAVLPAGAFYIWHAKSVTTPVHQITSIAVLPLQNESGNPDVEFLSDGLTESLISSLSQIQDLNVKARSSVFRFKGKDLATKEIAKQLDVQAILTGRVVHRGQDLTLYIELVDGANENTLWKNDYHRQMANLVALQGEVARDVAGRLKSRLAASDEQKLAKTHTNNAEAYELLLRARYVSQTFTPDAWRKAIDYCNQALQKDPNYAPAFSMIAEAYDQLSYIDMPPSETGPKAKEAAKRAMEIDDSLASAHVALGLIKTGYDRDQPGAEREFKRAVELSPGEAAWHARYGWYLSQMGRFEEGMAELKQAQTLDPLNEVWDTAIAFNSSWAGHTDLAIEQMQKVIEHNPHYGIAHHFLGLIYAQKGRFPEALAELRRSGELGFAGAPIQIAQLGYVHGISGNREEALKQLDLLKDQSHAIYVSGYHFALVHLGLGDKEKALQSLEHAYQERSGWLTTLKDPKFNSLRSDLRFLDLMRRVGLTP